MSDVLPIYPATTQVPKDPDHTDVNKAVLDLLNKINNLSGQASAAIETQSEDLAILEASLVVGPVVLTGVTQASAISLSNGVTANVLSFSLPAGIWDVSGAASFSGAPVLTSLRYGISMTSAAFGAPSGEAPDSMGEISFRPPLFGTTAAVNSPFSIPIPSYRIVLTAPTTFWLVVQVGFSSGTVTGFGWVQAVQTTKGVLS